MYLNLRKFEENLFVIFGDCEISQNEKMFPTPLHTLLFNNMNLLN